MYYLSGYEREGKLGVADTEDNKEEFFPREILLGSGQTIYGLSTSLGVGTKFSNCYFDFEVEKQGIHVTLREDLKSRTILKLSLPPTIAGIKVTSLSRCFYNCKKLTSLDLTNFTTRNVKDMDYMFFGCDSLISIDFGSFYTRNVKNMSYMFFGCDSLISIDLGSFDTRNVKYMNSMFRNCKSLTYINLSSFDTRNITDMSAMFSGCESLTSLDLRNFDTRNVEYMSCMFSYCTFIIFSSFELKYDGLILLTRNHSSKYETIKVKMGTSKEVLVSKLLLSGLRGTYNLEEV